MLCLKIPNHPNKTKMLCSNLVKHLKDIVIVALVLVSYASNVLSRSDQIAKNAINTDKSGPNNATTTTTTTTNTMINMKKVPFVEYYIEHNINEGEAKRSFFETGIKSLDGKCRQMICIFLRETKTLQTS